MAGSFPKLVFHLHSKLITSKGSSTAILNFGPKFFSTSIAYADTASDYETDPQLRPQLIADVLYSLKKPHQGLSLFRQLKVSGFEHDVSTYAAIITILCHAGLQERLDSVLFDLILYNSVEASLLLDKLGDSVVDDAEQPSLLFEVYDALVKLYARAGLIDEATHALFQMGRRGFLPRVCTCNFLFDKVIKNKKLDKAVATFENLKKLGLSCNDDKYTIVMGALCKKMLKGCKADNIPIDASAYGVASRGFCNEMKLDEAESVLLEMEKEGVVPDMHCYNELIHGFCKGRNWQKAYHVLNDMILKNIKIDCVVVGSILHCMCEMGMS
ncbi:pentatricopeptide repeat-containing protein At2g26790, mitochondrial [Jatropha curcas]|nr:pentatricopeptide repeat-containing protein At2g26790, mitochondrial [Jatropha curcas]